MPIQFLKVHDFIILITLTIVQALSQTILEHFASSKEDPQALYFPVPRAVENYAVFWVYVFNAFLLYVYYY